MVAVAGGLSAPRLRLEFHCHTDASRDSQTRVEDLLQVCRQRGIDRLVITDHNTIAGALAAQALDPQRAIVGEEIMTTQGELLAAFVQEEIPKGLTPPEAIARLREQGAFISVSHPFDRLRKGGWRPPDLLAILPLVDAIEVFNARCWPGWFNRQAAAFAHQHGLLGTVGSDAHSLVEVGRATLHLPAFRDAAGLRAALPLAQQEVRRSGLGVRFASRRAAWHNRQ